MILEAVLCVSILLPPSIYAWAYLRPWQFLKYFAAVRFEQIGIVLKLISNPLEGYFALRSGLDMRMLPLGIALFVLGQILNSAVYRRLGGPRTYYGYEFGILPAEQINGFPFYLFHAQYKGSLLSAIGIFIAFAPSPALTIATICWVIGYIFIIQIEDGPPGPHTLKDD